MLNDSAISGNVATTGGGIFYYEGSITVNHSTISANSACSWEYGSGPNEGGGIWTAGGSITLNDSTIGGNSAENHGGGIYNHGTTTLTNCIAGVNVLENTPDNIYTAP